LIDPRITALYTKTCDLVGIDESRKELITKLTKKDGQSAEQRIVSIVGFGGLGKTTLAKAVYDKIKSQYNCMAFVSVSRNPDMAKNFIDLLYELDKTKHSNIHNITMGQKQLIDEVQEFLQNKRYAPSMLYRILVSTLLHTVCCCQR
jgi:disease resistance protein RPM1